MSSGSVQYGMKYESELLPMTLLLLEQGATEIEPINGVYLVEDTKTYTVTVTKQGFVEFTDTDY